MAERGEESRGEERSDRGCQHCPGASTLLYLVPFNHKQPLQGQQGAEGATLGLPFSAICVILPVFSLCTFFCLSQTSRQPRVSVQPPVYKHVFSVLCGISSCRFIFARASVTNYLSGSFHILDFTSTWLEK